MLLRGSLAMTDGRRGTTRA